MTAIKQEINLTAKALERIYNNKNNNSNDNFAPILQIQDIRINDKTKNLKKTHYTANICDGVFWVVGLIPITMTEIGIQKSSIFRIKEYKIETIATVPTLKVKEIDLMAATAKMIGNDDEIIRLPQSKSIQVISQI